MRIVGLALSLLALAAALALLVADSMGPCSSFEITGSDYDYVLICEGEIVEEGSVSFGNPGGWTFQVIEDDDEEGTEAHDEIPGGHEPSGAPGAERPGESAEEVPAVTFAIAFAEADYSDCSPGDGIGVYIEAVAEVEARWEDGMQIFGCDVYPQADTVECGHGRVQRWVDPDEEGEIDEAPVEHPCKLVLTRAQADR